MKPSSYPCPLPDGSSADEYALVHDQGAAQAVPFVKQRGDNQQPLRRTLIMDEGILVGARAIGQGAGIAAG
ncbi:MAG: hypothetical protein ACK44O_13035, partial [Novosphingobium sp.]